MDREVVEPRPPIDSATPQESLAAVGVSHAYEGVPALSNVTMRIAAGEIHGLIGANGSGKSTLIRVMTGAISPLGGELQIDGEPVRIGSPLAAQQHRIGVVHQDYNLFPELSVGQNIAGVSAALPRRGRWGPIDQGELRDLVHNLLEELGIDIPPARKVSRLGAAERKFVEIARAMILDPAFLILDEPTASLEPTGADAVLSLIERLRQRGVGICFVSHRLNEVLRVVDQVTVLRDGEVVASLVGAETDEGQLVHSMLGEAEDELLPPAPAAARPVAAVPALRIEDLRLAAAAEPISLALGEGEILGLTGLLGSGASEVPRWVAGSGPEPARLELRGEQVKIGTPGEAIAAGIGFIPEDRDRIGLVLDASVLVNMSLASLSRQTRFGVFDRRGSAAVAAQYCRQLGIKHASLAAPIRTLSGGNKQKTLIARWLAAEVKVLAIEEPTHGVDVRGKEQIHELLRRFVAEGGSVLVASTDVEELAALCDRIAVFRHGAVVRVAPAAELSQGELARLGLAGASQASGDHQPRGASHAV